MKRRLTRSRSAGRFAENEGVNPIEGVANLADAMLIFSVGAMLALIINWHVDINPTDAASASRVDKNNAVTFSQQDLTPVEGQENPSNDGMKKLGTVYYDEKTKTYYILGAADAVGSGSGGAAGSASPQATGNAAPDTSGGK